MGQVRVNVIGIWPYGFKDPLWILTNLDPEEGLALYDQRMKIEICFRDLKSLLNLDKIMNKAQVYLDKMIAMLMLAYAISVIIGEAIRDVQYAQVSPREVDLLTIPPVEKRSRWYLFSGLFLLLKQRYRLPKPVVRQVISAALSLFRQLILALIIRTLART